MEEDKMAKKVLRSEICERFGVEYPIFLAGMGAVPGMPRTGKYYTGTSVELVAAVSNAGGYGVLGAAELSPAQIHEAVNDIKALTSKPFGLDLLFPAEIDRSSQEAVDEQKANLPKDYKDYYAWMDTIRKKYELPEANVTEHMKRAFDPDFVRAQFDAALAAEGPSAICSGVGTSKWAVERIHEAGKISVSLVGNVRQARKVTALGTDIIVAQGTEAGGHTGRIGTLALVPQVVDAVSPIPVLAAGGIGDGRGVAAAFTLGAKGVWVGTAFLASKETGLTEESLQKIIDADENGTFISTFFTGKTCRSLRHPIAEEWEQAGYKTLGMPLQLFSVIELMDSMEKSGKTELFYVPSGQISGMINKVRTAKEVFDEMVSTAVKMLKGGELEGITVAEG
jgi:NAD(P)H-dependent flavin oxidoreductase YrpB (nitropropane dioxygenase family)